MSPLTPFKFENKTISVVTDDAGSPWFCANDVCTALGYTNPWKTVADHIDADDLTKREVIDAIGRKQMTNFINESGMYALVFGSTKPEAKRFKRWVTSEVLPSIRKTGGYQRPVFLGSKLLEKFAQQRGLPHLNRHQQRVVNQKANSMGRELAETCRDYLLWELAGSTQSGGEHGPDYVHDWDVQALLHFAATEEVTAFSYARRLARMQAHFEALRG
jgi:prophage antirepressor-like protein